MKKCIRSVSRDFGATTIAIAYREIRENSWGDLWQEMKLDRQAEARFKKALHAKIRGLYFILSSCRDRK